MIYHKYITYLFCKNLDYADTRFIVLDNCRCIHGVSMVIRHIFSLFLLKKCNKNLNIKIIKMLIYVIYFTHYQMLVLLFTSPAGGNSCMTK